MFIDIAVALTLGLNLSGPVSEQDITTEFPDKVVLDLQLARSSDSTHSFNINIVQPVSDLVYIQEKGKASVFLEYTFVLFD